MYKVIFSLSSYLKFQAYIDQKDTEISGLGKTSINKENKSIYISDLITLPQTATGVNTVFNVGDFLEDTITKGLEPSDYKLWWHSHVNMPVFWSGTDLATMEDFDTEFKENNWILSIVGNKRKEILCRLDLFEPFRITFDKLPWEIDFNCEMNNEISKLVEEEIKKNFIEDIKLNIDWDELHKIYQRGLPLEV